MKVCPNRNPKTLAKSDKERQKNSDIYYIYNIIYITKIGVKNGESNLRKRQYNSCFQKNGKFTPLWDLTDELEDKIYKKYNIEIPQIYEHISRTGCIGCPYGSYKKETEKELSVINNSRKKIICNLFKESYEILGIKENK